jgi:predicted MFS family arabinose efflux permease
MTKKVAAFTANNFLFTFTAWPITTYMSLYLRETIGLPPARIGLLVSLFFFTTILMTIPFGYLSDRFSPRKLMHSGSLIIALTSLSLAYFKNIAIIPSLIVAMGAGMSMFAVSMFSLYYKLLGPERRGAQISVFLSGMYLGWGFGLMLGGRLLGTFGMEYVFITSAALGLVLFSLTFLIEDSSPIRFNIIDYVGDVRRKEVLLVISVYVILAIHFGTEHAVYPIFLRERVGLNHRQIGEIYPILGIWLSVIGILTGLTFDKVKNAKYLLIGGLLAGGIFQGLTVLARSFWQVVDIRIVHTLGDSMVIFCANIFVSNVFVRQRLGGNYGFIKVLEAIGISAGAVASGFLLHRWGYSAAFWFSGGACIALALFIGVFGAGLVKKLAGRNNQTTDGIY